MTVLLLLYLKDLISNCFDGSCGESVWTSVKNVRLQLRYLFHALAQSKFV